MDFFAPRCNIIIVVENEILVNNAIAYASCITQHFCQYCWQRRLRTRGLATLLHR